MDFTQTTYKTLLETLKLRDFSFLTFESYLYLYRSSAVSSVALAKEGNHSLSSSQITGHSSLILLRHDVDRLPQNSLKLAQLEHSLGIKGTYYFRVVPESYDPDIMHKIVDLGHEIGYHYEDVDLVSKKHSFIQPVRRPVRRSRFLDEGGSFNEEGSSNHSAIQPFSHSDLIDAAHESFLKNLELFRKNFDIQTICMHGSPRAKYDNKIIWEKYNYKDLGLIGEPYYDIDFNQFAYFTDTGRRWNGNNVSVRDKVNSKYKFNFKTTQQIIDKIDKLPDKVMFTIHPERWHDSALLWTKELIWQNAKNVVKRIIASKNSNSA